MVRFFWKLFKGLLKFMLELVKSAMFMSFIAVTTKPLFKAMTRILDETHKFLIEVYDKIRTKINETKNKNKTKNDCDWRKVRFNCREAQFC